MHARLGAVVHVPVNDALNGRISDGSIEFFHVQTEPFRYILYLDVAQARIILKEFVAEFVKFSLPVRGQRGSGRLARELVHGKGKVLHDKLDVFGVFIQQLLEERFNPRTVWSLVVAEHRDGDRCVLRALERKSGQEKLLNDLHLDELQCFSGAAGQDERLVSG